MFIQTEATPNPATMKFLPGQTVLTKGTAQFETQDEAKDAPLAERLLTLAEVTLVFYGPDFISVTKTEDADWDLLKARILAEIMDHFTAGFPVVTEAFYTQKDESAAANDENESELDRQIKELLEMHVKPAVAQDGGNIEFVEFDQGTGIVYLSMEGACAGCPSSTMTLKSGVENLLRHYVPEVLEVQAVV